MSELSIGILETRRNAKVKGERHSSNILTKKVAAKTKATYAPVEMLGEVTIWTQNFKRAKKRNLAAVNSRDLKK